MVAESACLATVDATLVEEARPERNGLRVEATSWSGGGLVSGTIETCLQGVAEATQSAVTDFVDMYRAMNPPSAT